MIDDITKKILQVVLKSDYSKGMNYDENYLEFVGITKLSTHNKKFQFLVESESSYQKYMVQIEINDNNIVNTFCTCPRFKTTGSCKHVAACLIVFSDKIFEANNKTITNKSLNFLKKLQNEFSNNFGKKEEVFLVPYLEFVDNYYYDDYIALKVKIGQNKMYSLLGKYSAFIDSFENNQPFSFGVNFTFDPNKHYFSEQSLALLDLVNIIKKHYRINGNSVYLESTLLKQLIKLMANNIWMENPERKLLIKKEFPIITNLSKDENDYHVDLNDINNIKPLTDDLEYVYFNNTIYQLNKEQQYFLKECLKNNIDELIVPENEFNSLQNNVIRLVKDNINLDESVKDLVIVSKPEVKFYFDLNEDNIVALPKFIYQDKELSYFEQDDMVIRDVNYENEIVNILAKYNFIKEDNMFLLDNFDDICDFIDSGLDELSQKYLVFTSEKIKDTKIVKNNTITSTFSIGKDNILHYEFDLGIIKEDELKSVLNALKQKKKYYKLNNGEVLNLENDSLKELNDLSEELDLNNGLVKGEIPKYRALYLDSLKNSNYHIIKTDSLFQNFIDNFKEYKNVSLKFTKEEKDILRNYQLLGIKWLYTIYKCGFGGILADEMGLGKSLQTIYFLRKILKEKNDAKFLIVCPTSLVYNWESEFVKFAKEINLHVFAENKEVRHNALKEFVGNVYITSYGLLREDLEFYQEKEFEIFIIDEAQNIKNPMTGLTKAVKSVNATTKFALTGTPIENSVVELWSIFDFIMPGFLASLMKFQKKYQVKEFNDDTNKLLENLKKQVKPFILRRKKKDVIKDLPPKTENNIYIDLNESQKKLYAAYVKDANDQMNDLIKDGGFNKNKMVILSLLTKLRQICISPALILKDYQEESSKIENLIKIIKELVLNNHKILLFTSFKTALNLVKDELEKESISSYEITGETTAKKRKLLVDAFNKDNTSVFLIMLKSGGTGLNLTSADVVIHLDLWWNPQAENQATDRTHRIGQTKNVEVIKLICKGTIEEKILELQQKKKMLSDKIIEEGMDEALYLKSLTEKDIRNLLSYENKD